MPPEFVPEVLSKTETFIAAKNSSCLPCFHSRELYELVEYMVWEFGVIPRKEKAQGRAGSVAPQCAYLVPRSIIYVRACARVCGFMYTSMSIKHSLCHIAMQPSAMLSLHATSKGAVR